MYPAPLRDLLMRLALTDLFKVRWTDKIHDEWINAQLKKEDNRCTEEYLRKTQKLMDQHCRDAKVEGYEDLIEMLELPDPDDRHVLAAAIKCNADAIVTFNQKDFPPEILAQYEIELIHPDDFVYCQLDLSPAKACNAIKAQREALKTPPKTKEEFLIILQKQKLPKTVSKIRREYFELI